MSLFWPSLESYNILIMEESTAPFEITWFEPTKINKAIVSKHNIPYFI